MTLNGIIEGKPVVIEIPENEIARLMAVVRHVRLTKKDLALRWGVSMATVNKRSRRIGRIVDGNSVRFPLPEVEEYERRRTLRPRF